MQLNCEENVIGTSFAKENCIAKNRITFSSYSLVSLHSDLGRKCGLNLKTKAYLVKKKKGGGGAFEEKETFLNLHQIICY